MEHRELTRQERMAIRALVIKWCANYDREYGCIAMGWPCYMLGKCWTGACCSYFREAVLPLDPGLEAALARDSTVSFRPCPMCGRACAERRAAQVLFCCLFQDGPPSAAANAYAEKAGVLC